MSSSDTEAPREDTPRPDSVFYDGRQPISVALAALDIPLGRPVIVVAGSASADIDAATEDALGLLIQLVIAPVCLEEGVVVVSGGTDAGVMAMLGNAMADLAPDCVLVGVAPDRKLLGYGAVADDDDAARAEPHHRLIRTPGNCWGGEGPTLVRVAERIAANHPIVVLGLGGGSGTRRELQLAARRRWPVLLVTGCAGTSEALAERLGLAAASSDQGSTSVMGPQDPVDAEVAEAAGEGCFIALDVNARPALGRVLRWRLSENELLKEAWARFAITDLVATQGKQPTRRLALCVVVLATATVMSALLLGASQNPPAYADSLSRDGVRFALKLAVTGLPLVAAVILGVIERRARTGTWIEMRAAAESSLREIYLARASAGPYSSLDGCSSRLSDSLAQIDARMAGRSAVLPRECVARIPWPPKELDSRIPVADSLVGPLDALSYDEARVLDQLTFMQRAASTTERTATRLATAMFVAAAATALLVAVSWRSEGVGFLAAVSASFAAAFVSWREHEQRDARVDTIRSTAAAVRSARAQWQAVPADYRNHSSHLASYVAAVEDALAAEGSDWERALRQAQQSFFDRYKGR